MTERKAEAVLEVEDAAAGAEGVVAGGRIDPKGAKLRFSPDKASLSQVLIRKNPKTKKVNKAKAKRDQSQIAPHLKRPRQKHSPQKLRVTAQIVLATI